MKCKYNHEGDCCNSGAGQYMCKCKLPCKYIVPMTNAEYIRHMSDEELAEFLCGVYDEDENFGKFINGVLVPCYDQYSIKEWLEQPAEEF